MAGVAVGGGATGSKVTSRGAVVGWGVAVGGGGWGEYGGVGRRRRA